MHALRTAARAAAVATLVFAAQAQAATWNWQYSGEGIAASGTFTTSDTANADGFYAITGITGSRNGVAITGLQAAGTAIPGNSDYPADDLVSISGWQLTWNGFGYALADGSYANPFSDEESSYYEYLSAAPYPEGDGQELAISFSATQVPEPATAWLALAGLGGLAALRRRQQAR